MSHGPTRTHLYRTMVLIRGLGVPLPYTRPLEGAVLPSAAAIAAALTAALE